MKKLTALALAWGVVCGGAFGCGGPVVSDTSSGGGGGATGGAGGATTTSSSSTSGGAGGTGGTTGGTGGAHCEVDGPLPCGQEPMGVYPDPLASYVSGNTIDGGLHPIPGFEDKTGAGTGRIGPFEVDMVVTGMTVILQDPLPDPVRLAIWTEPQCGLPSDNPNDHAVDVPKADLAPEDLGGGFFYKATWTLNQPFTIPVGASVYPSVITTEFSVSLAAIEPNGEVMPRAMWYGIVDNNCDGEIDPNLGYAYVAAPSAPGGGAYLYDLGFTIIATPSPQ